MLSEKGWKPGAAGQLILGILLSLMVGMMLSGGLSRWSQGWNRSQVQLIHFAIATASFQGTTLTLVILFLRDQKLSWTAAFGFTTRHWKRAVLLALATFVINLVGGVELGWAAAEFMRWSGASPEPQLAVQAVQSAGSIWQTGFYALIAIGLAPVAEELLFRGIIYPTLKQVGHPQLALWITSLLFAASHVNWMAFVPLFFVALMLTLLYEATDNLWAPILAHSWFNLANFTLLLHADAVERWIREFYDRI